MEKRKYFFLKSFCFQMVLEKILDVIGYIFFILDHIFDLEK